MKDIKSSVIIPARGRNALLDRAVASIIKSKGSDLVEIVIVDDASPEPINVELLREHDSIIRLTTNSGAAVARNKGIESARGQLLYLMDSDDYIVERDFDSDFEKYSKSKQLWYSQIYSQGFSKDYPACVTLDNFFDFIFSEYPHICQTSSLFFSKELGLKFDESLPKHQDWDFVLFSALKSGIEVRRGQGVSYFDRGDRKSLSRSGSSYKSDTWYSKILADDEISKRKDLISYIRFNLYSQYPNALSWRDFFVDSLKFFFTGKSTIRVVLVKLAHRLIFSYNNSIFRKKNETA